MTSSTRLFAVADDTVNSGSVEHPTGAALVTSKYCAVVLDLFASEKETVLLNVLGSSAGTFGQEGVWSPEVKPISIAGDGSNGVQTFVVPLRHNITEFFLSTPEKPGIPVANVNLGGSMHVDATAISCGAKEF